MQYNHIISTHVQCTNILTLLAESFSCLVSKSKYLSHPYIQSNNILSDTYVHRKYIHTYICTYIHTYIYIYAFVQGHQAIWLWFENMNSRWCCYTGDINKNVEAAYRDGEPVARYVVVTLFCFNHFINMVSFFTGQCQEDKDILYSLVP